MAGNPGGRWFDHERWWQKEGDSLANAVWAIATSLETDQSWRRNRARESLSLYEGRKLKGLHAGAYLVEGQYEEYDLNVSRAACDTVVAEIAGRQKPMPKFQTSGADWKTKRRAKGLEKFCLGVLQQRQGQFLNAWELLESCFLDAAIWGEGIAKVFWCDGRIRIERHFAHELYVDPVEARYGDPKNLFHVYTMERDRALWEFATNPELDLTDERRQQLVDAINGAEDVDPEIYGNNPRVAKVIKIVEAWRLRHSGDQPGKHAFVINNVCLFEEDWTRDSFPFVKIVWEIDRMGFHAKGLVEQGEPIHHELNNNAIRLQERFRLCASKRTYYEDGSVDLEDMQANDAEVLIRVTKGSQFPQETVPKPIAEAEMVWYNDCFQKYFELTGVSQMRASARKEPGVTAGVAIRTLNDMQTARFALKAKAYENAYVQLANQFIQVAREAAETEEVTVKYEKEINWKDVEVPEDTFDISIAPASSLPNDPAGRLQMAQELFEMGLISPETTKQLLGWPDLERESNHQTAQTRYVEKLIDKMLDATDMSDYEGPDGLLIDKPRAFLQVSQSYLEALYNDAPPTALTLLRRYLTEMDKMLASLVQPPLPEAGGAPGDPPPDAIPLAPGGGAPPMAA